MSPRRPHLFLAAALALSAFVAGGTGIAAAADQTSAHGVSIAAVDAFLAARYTEAG